MIFKNNIKNKSFFSSQLMQWNARENQRDMPWKNEKDPYKIWISEIILQQTRVRQGTQYYRNFVSKYPSVLHLANAKENEVFKLWEGLGYYNRCKNLILSAKYIANELHGIFPHDFESILKLKGVGNYTASAIASFAYNLPHAVLDGNVFRILSRFFGIFMPIDNNGDKKVYSTLAHELLDKKYPGVYNQSIMDFGATVCKPQIPLCNACPLRQKCFAFLNNVTDTLPVKEKIINRKSRWFYYLLIEYKSKLYIRKRLVNDIWQNLNEFVLIETPKPVDSKALQASPSFKSMFSSIRFIVTSVSKIYKQQLTHQTITGQFLNIKVDEPLSLSGYKLTSKKQLQLLPFPKFITAFLKH